MAVLLDMRPFANTSEQNEEFLSEVDCLLVLYFLVMFTGTFIHDPILREDIGFVLVVTQVTFLAIVILRLLFSLIKALYRRCKLSFLIRQAHNKKLMRL